MKTIDTDQELWEGIKKGNEQAFSALFNRYSPKIYSSAYNYIRDSEVCEQIVHDIFLGLWQNRESLVVQCFKAYLTTAARYRVYKHLIAHKTIPIDYKENMEVCDSLTTVNSGYSNMVCDELHVEIDSSLRSLPKRCREIFLMSRRQLLSNGEIGKDLGISRRTVENQITYALRRLRLSLKSVILFL
jgi:RNA polymerase sigma-70 factor (family 1)